MNDYWLLKMKFAPRI